MNAIEKMEKRTAELLEAKAGKVNDIAAKIQEAKAKADALKAEVEAAHAAGDYEKEIEKNQDEEKARRIVEAIRKDYSATEAGELLTPEEYKDAADKVIKQLDELTAKNNITILEILDELEKIRTEEADTIERANKALHAWQYKVNGARDIKEAAPGFVQPSSLLKYSNWHNVEYLNYILQHTATAQYKEESTCK